MPAVVKVPSAEVRPEIPEARSGKNIGLAWYFSFFFVSGFCSILYELIWLRLAMAQFGITTPLISIILSTFMAGLGVGSWAAGRLIHKYAQRISFPALRLYSVAEILIACSALLVPIELHTGRVVLEHLGSSLALSSSGYYIAAGLWMACTLVPWCACMGATIPLGMFAIRRDSRLESQRSFSFLYLANVLGAVAGSFIPLLLIELWGFSGTLRTAMLFNVGISGAAFVLAGTQTPNAGINRDSAETSGEPDIPAVSSPVTSHGLLAKPMLWLLFATGLTSMGLEVVWTRLFTIYLGTFVYSFALILAVYLLATFIGSSIYRWWSRRHSSEWSLIWLLVWFAALIPLLSADKRVALSPMLRVSLGIGLFSALLGFLTPRLVDRFAEGDPNRAGVGYAVNVAGCILGPLVAGFGLLPYLDERYALVALALPWLLIGLLFMFARQTAPAKHFRAYSVAGAMAIVLTSCWLIVWTRSYIHHFPGAEVRRDNTATVMAAGSGIDRQLYVNGISMTVLKPVTKAMAALPLAFLDRPPQNALVVCFGMGTTYRSMLSWGIDSTAVELVPSVPQLFGYFHSDGPTLLKSPRSHVVIDDGRRFLERSTGQYDAIMIDPPPPIGTAGSSLLYSREFYATAKKRLRPDGILQQWFAVGDRTTASAVTRALKESFPYVRAFSSFEGWGVHYLASSRPIPNLSASELARRMPPSAAADFTEWGPFPTAEEQFTLLLKREIPIDFLINLDKNAPVLEDDRPVNEYGLLRNRYYWPYDTTTSQ